MKTTTDAPKILSDNTFPVVGIGASAGGLEAFKKLISAIPEQSGMAYVLVQHLNPNAASILPMLLQKITPIPVIEISDEIKVQPDHIYIIPSNKMLVANDGVLQLSPRPLNAGSELNLPIDLFFSSLAEVHQAHSIGVVLSGTASDGTAGLSAIKDHGGVTFAQDEASAAYEGMPNSAALAGVVDFILPPEEIPGKLLEIKEQVIRSDEELQTLPLQDETAFKQILFLLRISKGTDFTYYKQTTVRRRIFRRIAISRAETPGGYLNFFQHNKEEQEALYQDLLISVTAFFRDPKIFETLCGSVFPELIRAKKAGDPVRIWVAGCSTGQEAYSIAMCLKEATGDSGRKIQIFATDLSELSITKARRGIYTKREVAGVSEHRLEQFFTKTADGYQINKELREVCVFALHNFLKDPPFGHLDLVSCRNSLIYMEPYLQKKALTTFHYALASKGLLLLGKSEAISSVPDLFTTERKSEKLFACKDVPGKFIHIATRHPDQGLQHDTANISGETIRTDFQKAADEILLSKYTPAGVVISDAMDIVHFRGNTSMYLEQASGKPTHNLLKLAKGGLAFELRSIIQKSKKEHRSILKEHIPVQPAGDRHIISIEVIPLPNIVEPHYLVLFHETPDPKPHHRNKTGPDERDLRILHLEQELEQTREDMRNITEDQDAANEELQSANEELLSGGEELQSLNEELETSKEELQSTNEELSSLNEQLSAAKHYAESIITTIREPMLVLDEHLRVKTANNAFYKTFRAFKQDTEGALIYDLGDKQWNIPALRTLLEDILPRRTSISDFEVRQNFPAIGERIMQLNACEMTIEGADEKLILLAIEDITEKKQHRLREQELLSKFQNTVLKAPVAICILKGPDYTIELANDFYLRIVSAGKDIIGQTFFESLPELKKQGMRELLDKVAHTNTPLFGYEVALTVLRNGRNQSCYFNFVYQPLPNPDKAASEVIVIATEVTDQVVARKRMESQAKMVQSLFMTAPGFVCVLKGTDHVYELVNTRYQELFGKRELKGKSVLEALPELKGQGFDTLLDNVYASGEPYVGIEIPITVARDEGLVPELRHFNFSYQPMYDDNNRVYAILVFGYEVTEQVNARHKVQELDQKHAAELEEKVALRTLELSEANEELQQKNQDIAISKYNKRFLTEFSDRFAGYRLTNNEFFNSLVQYIADLTHLDYVLVGRLEETAPNEFTVQTIAITAFGKLAENIRYPLPDGPCEQVVRGTMYAYPENARKTFPNNQTLAQFKVEGYLGYPLYDAQGVAVGLIAVMHGQKIEDVETTASVLKIVAKRAEMELERTKNEQVLAGKNKMLEEQNEALIKMNHELESFTYVSSHDLKEPLRKIQTFAALILQKDYAALSDSGKDSFQRMQLATKRMQILLEDLLAYSLAGLNQHGSEKAELGKIIEAVKADLSGAIQTQQAVIEASGPGEVNVNVNQFGQVLNNLLANALKFSRPGIPPHITIISRVGKGLLLQQENPGIPAGTLSPEKDYCHIAFTDNGIGFDPQYKGRIFEVFQRLHNKETYAGTGIGLAIVKKIIENHGGIITASGEPDKGATFDIYIPA